MMTYEAACEALMGALPMFQRTGPAAYKADLDGTWEVMEFLERPDLKMPPVIHIAGTNGKGSVCTMIAQALQDSGHKVGLFTSPHLVDFRERIRINGRCIPKEAVVAFVEDFAARGPAFFGDNMPSFFEMTFGMACAHFVAEAVNVVVLETGMGGRLDSTNIFPRPLLSVITNVGLDHQAFLGNDVRSIAAEKAGIIKDGVPVVLGRMRPEAQSVMLSRALQVGAEVHYAPAAAVEATYRAENESTALKALEVLGREHPKFKVENPQRSVQSAVWPGRWQWLEDSPVGANVLVDCAHNADGLARWLEGIEKLKSPQVHIVFGTVADKPVKDVVPVLASLENAVYYWCAADIPRAKAAEDLKTEMHTHGLNGQAFESVAAAFEKARNAALSGELVAVVGSIFVAAEVLKASGAPICD